MTAVDPAPHLALGTVARQPILDTTHRRVGYELLHRGVEDAPRERTAEVIVDAVSRIGLTPLVGDARAWVNVPVASLLEQHHLALPPNRVVLELLEDFVDADELVALADAARSAGYTVAVDDYASGTEQERLVDHADVIKVDLLAPGAFAAIEALAGRGVCVLAEKVETVEEHRRAADAGATLFQGFYFARPELIEHAPPGQTGLQLMRLVGLLHVPEPDLVEVAMLVETDPVLTAQTLTLVNSTWVSPNRRFTSVRDAVVYLGLDQIRRIAMIALVRGIGLHAPLEVLRTGVLRAALCERAAVQVDAATAYTVGLLSVLDAATGCPLDAAVLAPLGLPDEAVDALLHRAGPLGQLMDRVDACVRGERTPGVDEHFGVAAAAADRAVALFDTVGAHRSRR